jgi:hypothetical protein
MLGLMEWLARRNRWPDAYTLSRAAVIAILLFTPVLLWLRPRQGGVLLALAAAANMIGTRAADHRMRSAYRPARAVMRDAGFAPGGPGPAPRSRDVECAPDAQQRLGPMREREEERDPGGGDQVGGGHRECP